MPRERDVLVDTGETCGRRTTCDGFLANSHPRCAATDLPQYAPCSGAGFVLPGFNASSSPAVGRCAASAPLPVTAAAGDAAAVEVHCMKVDRRSAECLTVASWRAATNASADAEPEILQCSTGEDASDAGGSVGETSAGNGVAATANATAGGNAVGDAEAEGVCCGRGAVPVRIGSRRSECCPWVVGLAAGEGGDGGDERACCLEVDACGVCGGNATAVDADSAPLLSGCCLWCRECRRTCTGAMWHSGSALRELSCRGTDGVFNRSVQAARLDVWSGTSPAVGSCAALCCPHTGIAECA